MLGRINAESNAKSTFDPTCRIIALTHQGYKVRLVDARTLQDLVVLEPPDALPARFLTFSADGSKLAVFTHVSHIVNVWDLRKLRAGLAEMGLDWDVPASPPPSQDVGQSAPRHIEIVPAASGM